MRLLQQTRVVAAAIGMLLSALWLSWLPAAAAPAVTIGGVVFFDRNGDGMRGQGEPALAGVTITLSDTHNFSQEATAAADGSYAFPGIASGSYTIRAQNPAGFISTTADTVALTVGSSDILVDFGVALPHTITGTVFDDIDLDGEQSLPEPGIAGAVIEVYDDADGDGAVSIGEALLGSAVSDDQGNYRIPNLLPGLRVLFVEIPADYHPAGNSGGEVGLDLISSEVGGNLTVVDVPLRKTDPAAANLTGWVWHDANGDGQIDAGEQALAGVVIALTWDANGNGQADADEPVATRSTAGAGGGYCLFDLPPGAYVAVVDASTLPAGWLLSPAMAARPAKLTAGGNALNLGYFDLLAVTPLRDQNWWQEALHPGAGLYDPAEFAALVAAAQARTRLFPALGPLSQALTSPARSPEAKARRQYAALLLNLSSGRLFAETPIDLPALTAATTAGAAAAEIEGVLWPPFGFAPAGEYDRALRLAETLNRGEGIGLCQPGGGAGSLVDAAQACR